MENGITLNENEHIIYNNLMTDILEETEEKMMKDIKEVVAYVIWSLSIWVLSYYQLSRNGIDRGYQVAIWLFGIAAVLLFGTNKKELTKEIFKSVFILIGTCILGRIYSNVGTLDGSLRMIFTLLIYEFLGYFFVWVMSKSKKLHAKYATSLEVGYLILIGILYFIFNWNLYVSLIIPCIPMLLIGYRLHIRARCDERIMAEKEKKEIEVKQREVERIKQIEIENDKLKIVNEKLKKENTKFINKERIRQTKSKRKRVKNN